MLSSQMNQPWPLSNLLKIATEKKKENAESQASAQIPWVVVNFRQGPGPYLIFYDMLTQHFFQGRIIARLCYDKCIFLSSPNADKDPKHTAAQVCIANEDINWVKTPAESPDLNPIELVWHQLKTFIHNCAKPTGKDELVKAIKMFWLEKLTIQQRNKYIDNLSKVLPVVVELGGKVTKI
ncbi:unnamed protein product [Oncorhynchus mykiss]|uniref:Tc1-like transposase DDE domain-containing protein n=1 Tax=Oncorhynchus mykiss TaxID=8022 RepID=A0A060XZW5_ONCMY|nr:unnamed protein product [Oncorhynchus mykiss]